MSSLSTQEQQVRANYEHPGSVDIFRNPERHINFLQAPAWDAYVGFQDEEAVRFMSKLVGNRVLSMGCGTASDIGVFEKQGIDYIGIDLSVGMLKAAVTRQPRPTVAHMNMRQLGFAGDSFDGIFAIDSFNGIARQDVPELLQDARRVLKPKGMFYANAMKGTGTTVDGGFTQLWQPHEMRQLFTKAGFSIVDFRHPNHSPSYIGITATPSE